VAMTLFLISATGLVTLGGASLARLGVDGLLATPSRSFAYMVLAGTFNAIGFFALGKSLRLISVVHANVLNASQAAIAVVAGILLFDEPSSWSLALGVALTLAGLVVVRNESEA
jgi:DME family drug/metabolite transporter